MEAGARGPQEGRIAFVVSHIEYALGADASEAGSCPKGMTEGYPSQESAFVFEREPLRPRTGEDARAFRRRLFGTALADPTVHDLCSRPDLGPPEPGFRTVFASDARAHGLDLDGVDSDSAGVPAPATCAHDDLVGMGGSRGIDNQWFRVVGCSRSFQSTGPSNTFAIEMLTGSWGILITLDGVDDLGNDPEVRVGLFANADPIELGPDRRPLAWATYSAEPDPRFRATTRGRIDEGVLTTDPVDLRWWNVINDMRLERPLDAARLRLRLEGESGARGILGGYSPVEAAYDVTYGFRTGLDASFAPSPAARRMGSAVGQARVLGHTCHGAWQAIHRLADANPDPDTGQCRSISMQFRIEAVPAFVVEITP